MNEAGPSGPFRTTPRRRFADLGPRLASALVLLPLTVIALWVGGLLFAALVGAVFAGAYREWDAMVNGRPPSLRTHLLAALLFLVALAFPVAGATGAAFFAAAALLLISLSPGPRTVWRLSGIVFFAAVILMILAIRGDNASGILAAVFAATVIWATDSGAFFAGRFFGGAKLSPGISPSKTWSGAGGGLLAGAIGGTLAWMIGMALLGMGSPWWIGLLLALAISILGQIGDLAESALKRRFMIKDSGDIIPGHGGLMDRLDSMTFAAFFVFTVGVLHSGIERVAEGFLFW